jgi:integrase
LSNKNSSSYNTWKLSLSKFGKVKSPIKQAESAYRAIKRSNVIASNRTRDNYKERLFQIAKNMPTFQISGDIYDLTKETAEQYLDIRGEEIGQETLNIERLALQCFMRVEGVIGEKEILRVTKSTYPQTLVSRAYTKHQVAIISNAQSAKHGLSTELAYRAGLRAHELFTLRPVIDKPADIRPQIESKWIGREGDLYTVNGKGGLIREVMIPRDLVNRLEATKRDFPERITDRKIHYIQHYDIGGGKNWSSSFSRVAKRVLGWSEGAHGVRHSYAQERMEEIQYKLVENGGNIDNVRDLALETVSQEMGHFRPSITETYLR